MILNKRVRESVATAERPWIELWEERAAQRRVIGRIAQLQFKMMCERPPRSLRSRLPLTRGRLTPATRELYSPLREGESRRRRQVVAHTPSGIGVGRGYIISPLRG